MKYCPKVINNTFSVYRIKYSSTFIFTHLDIYFTLCFYHLVLASIFVTCYILQLESYYLVLALFQLSWVRKTAAGVDL